MKPKLNTYKVGKVTIAACIMVAAMCTAWDDFVEVGTPNAQLSSSTVFDNTATANAAMAYLYASLREQSPLSGNPQGLSLLMGLYTDELAYYATASEPAYPFYNNNLLLSNTTLQNYWNTMYNGIYAANAVIEGTAASAQIPQPDRERLQGEALVVRALMHLYLCSLFGDVPYVAQTDYRINATITKITSAQVQERVIEDLEQAVTLLPLGYTSTERVTPNRMVAQGLLSRAYLYAGQWDKAFQAATQVINSGAYQLATEPSEAFLRNSPEVLWQLSPAVEGYPTLEAATFTLFGAPPQQWALQDNFVSVFQNDDLRKAQWMGTVAQGTQIYYYPAKYKQHATAASSSEYSVIVRLAEILLIRAESAVHLGQLDTALNDLNLIRQRAGLAPLSQADPELLLQAILSERAKELFCEQGHRFFDLRRFDALDGSLATIKPGWQLTDRLFPLPQTELNLNPNLLPQNPGY